MLDDGLFSYLCKRSYMKQAQDFFGDDFELFLESAKVCDYDDFVLETLTTHDIEKVIEKLQKTFKNISCEKYINGSFTISYTEKIDEKLLTKLLDFYGYFVREKDENIYFIEPTNAEVVSSEEKRKYHNVFYHFTDKETAMKILSTGLRCKTNSYSNIPARIYLYATEDIHKENQQELKRFISSVTNMFKIRHNGLSVLRIDLNKLNNTDFLQLYKDPAMKNKKSVFTYYNIPKQCIKEIIINNI